VKQNVFSAIRGDDEAFTAENVKTFDNSCHFMGQVNSLLKIPKYYTLKIARCHFYFPCRTSGRLKYNLLIIIYRALMNPISSMYKRTFNIFREALITMRYL